jgi:DNA repair exonuclease SbcCD ATPase subunit
MIEFKTLSVFDFGCIKELEIPLAHRGLVLILGNNLDSTAADSNGSGKSTIFKALSWVLFGKTVDGLKGDAVIRVGVKTAVVKIDMTKDGVEWSAQRTKSRGKAETLSVFFEEKPLGEPSLHSQQQTLEKMLGLDWMSFSNTVLYGQGDIYHFADPRTTDSQRKAVLSRILRLEELEKARAVARLHHRRSEEDINKCEMRKQRAEVQLETCIDEAANDAYRKWEKQQKEHIEEHEAQIENLFEKVKGVKKIQLRKARLSKTKKGIVEVLNDFQVIRQEYHDSDNMLQELSKQAAIIRSSRQYLQKEAQKYEEDIAIFNSGKCPVCHTPASSLHVKNMLTTLKKKVSLIQKKIEKEKEKKQQFIKESEPIAQRFLELKEELEHESEWKENLAEVDEKISQADEEIFKLETLKAKLEVMLDTLAMLREQENPHKKRMDEAKANIDKLKHSIKYHKKQLIELIQIAQRYAFWMKGFGPAGLQSYLLDSIMPIITQMANRYLEILSDGDLTIQIDTLTSLKSGAVKEKLNLKTVVEGCENVPLSGGQLKKVTLACDLALMDVVAKREGVSIDILLLDEVLDGLDPAGRMRVMDLLEYLRAKRQTIFVISHDPEIAEKFSDIITITKKDGVASL